MIGAAPQAAAKRAANMPAIWARNVMPTVVVTARWMNGVPVGPITSASIDFARGDDEGGDNPIARP